MCACSAISALRTSGRSAALGSALRKKTMPVAGRRRFKGTLLGLSGDAVKIRLEDGQETQVPLAAVTRAKLEMTDLLLDEHRRVQQGADPTH